MSESHTEMVPCPVCHGTKQLPHQKPGGCLCCKGLGEVTAEHAERLGPHSCGGDTPAGGVRGIVVNRP